MNKTLLFIGIALLQLGLNAQANTGQQIKWTVAGKKTGVNSAEIYFQAVLAPTWHIWSQTPGDEMLIPPTFTFKDKGVVATGKAREIGKKISKTEEGFKDRLHYYEGKVVFVQKIKTTGQKNITGLINYQICDPKRCLPPTDFDFNVTLK